MCCDTRSHAFRRQGTLLENETKGHKSGDSSGVMEHDYITLALQSWWQKDQEFQDNLGYRVNLREAWAMPDCV